MPKASTANKTQRWIQNVLDDARARDITVLDVRKVCDFTDYMVIATGTSNRHVQSTADKVVDALRVHGVRSMGVEGGKVGDWVLIDFGDVVVHVMREETRDFYNLEKLWSDAKRISNNEKTKIHRKGAKNAKKKELEGTG
ncbi:MAG: ribosome silencing factor [Candidatus Muproteobacteria bacterium RIFCSPHIGHO2_12_FULL_60_33]|uniref:Ribosomal silencing factor RsfS n=1 Tax=Candidatus Muproteobacteria bacterium RIFCSPLOWO2_01_FULL_60_18 TaxID=1817768 RepID=A0A1F6U0G2_9PROT|nr:MAG: ribosome silencing factor [Candidatus Muproteobacteria bacterium RIFCSPHIGHO2_01_60_12]OGI50856.1 MAG: ribosome silencing factor [Candidatus Muproteobacteria bacterium RIFCSPLOWO2_01_FULL_60_18]OGI55496.1 MAG: ribosome silencing factor [Candidatus Muproteobacteria bacterium RIFCSPHIGHO2_12_FULL_60_33]OGI56738.1 MAG: ribosome silencing factor [Candidatus Muproteobacteria bacterium RIFCSPHIGHO2_02_FULL_60_13]OGI60823.1 MAG: ribosome silencing factor [Candidatus Muproteobacteria bacterium 